MNRVLFFSALLLCSITTLAQNTMMAGKIVDEDGNPLKGAIIQLKNRSAMLETRSDDDGLFYTQLLPEGNYKLGIEANGAYYKMKNLWLLPAQEKKFYYFSIKGKRIYVRIDGEDPFLKSKLSKIADKVPLFDFASPRGGTFIMKRDSVTGKYAPLYGGIQEFPRMK